MRARLEGMSVALILLVALLIAAGCQGVGGDRHALDGSAWRLKGWKLNALDPNDFTITAEFADGKISGHSGVNAYGGPYTAGPGAAFSVGDLAVGAMGGLGPDMQAEHDYLELLGKAKSYGRNGDRLVLHDQGGNELLVFRASVP